MMILRRLLTSEDKSSIPRLVLLDQDKTLLGVGRYRDGQGKIKSLSFVVGLRMESVFCPRTQRHDQGCLAHVNTVIILCAESTKSLSAEGKP